MKKYLSLLVLILNILYPRECLIQHDPDERSERPEKDTFSISPSGHFYIHYDTTGNATPDLTDIDLNGIPDYIDEVSMIADSAYHVLVNVLGYDEEPFDGEGGYDIYLTYYSSAFVYGYCHKDIPSLNSDRQTSWLEIDNDYTPQSNKSNFELTPFQIMRISLGHEYFHAVQYGYKGNFGNNAYYYEMTSMWF